MNSRLLLALKGAAMGVVEVIPGVSGGTIAFITQIYEELIETIKSFDGKLLRLLLEGKWSEAWKKINGGFLLGLLSGMFMGLVLGIFVFSYLLEEHAEILWGFFFGLVLASSIYIARQLDHIDSRAILFFILGTAIAFFITTITPANGSETLLTVFLSAMVAVVALILPGISGSFILLLLGMYGVIIPQVKELLTNPNLHSLLICVVFGLGAMCGIAFFSRFLSYAFKKFRRNTLALLTGFMIGSLNKIWPWRNPVLALDEDTLELVQIGAQTILPEELLLENIKIIKEKNVFPKEYYLDGEMWLVLAAMALGISVIFAIDIFQRKTLVLKSGTSP